MIDLTRREFIHAATGVAVGGAFAGKNSSIDIGRSAASSRDSRQNAEQNDAAGSSLRSLIFPEPREISASGADFVLDGQVVVAVPSNASEQDLFLARSLVHELSDHFGLYLNIVRTAKLSPGMRVILMGSIENPLVQRTCAELEIDSDAQALEGEGYLLQADSRMVLVAGKDNRGAFYGFQSLRQLVAKQERELRIPGLLIRDWPDKPFRGIYMYLPGCDNIAYFKRFVRDFAALYKFNTLIVEMNSCMRLDSHPELNRGWAEFARDVNYSCRNYPLQPAHDLGQNSSHQDTADGGFLEKEEVADLAAWVRKHHIEFIPCLPSFTHSYYLLTGHRDLAAIPEHKWPDIYCPTNDKSYSLVFEVYDEFIEVLNPKSIHIGHDELFLEVDGSPQCKDTNIGELFGEDVKKIHDYLATKGIKTQLWGDMLLERVRGHGLRKGKARDGWAYTTTGALTPYQVERLIPKDCLIFNWFWSNDGHEPSWAEQNEAELDRMGFKQIFGNMEPTIDNYEARRKRSSLIGAAPSAWMATNEVSFGKDLMSSFLGCSSILWTGHIMPGKDLAGRVQALIPSIRIRLSGITPPSQTEISIIPVDISSRFNVGDNIQALGVDLSGIRTGRVNLNNVPFDLKDSNGQFAIVIGTEGKEPTGLVKVVSGILVGEAPTSLVFLHASARRAKNRECYRMLWDQLDTADLLGWYEVVYEDDFVITIPIRYGVNILEWNWEERVSSRDYCYNADALRVSGRGERPITLFAYEWVNPRLGKTVREIRLKGTTGYRGGPDGFSNESGPVIASNAVMLAALSLVRKRV